MSSVNKMSKSDYQNLKEALIHYDSAIKIYPDKDEFKKRLQEIERIQNVEKILLIQYSKNFELNDCKFSVYQTKDAIGKYFNEILDEEKLT